MGLRNIELSDDQALRWQEAIQSLGFEVVEEEVPPTSYGGVTKVVGRAFLLREADKWFRVYLVRKPDMENLWLMVFMEHERGCSRKLASRALRNLKDMVNHGRPSNDEN